jgi:hypothetical protein
MEAEIVMHLQAKECEAASEADEAGRCYPGGSTDLPMP